ncbi:hypothetical protein [Telluribacter sp.]|jgi:hypothetical protein|uniref:hypothetical protein n=1 Tax=Telluribacter sp. TaxID=1978767 RepID=UPI002E117353|nr:hypothetical protein [Telluribacter sp.]
MNRQEKSVLRVVMNGLCLFALLGLAACSDNKENEEGEMGSEGTATAETYDSDKFYSTIAIDSQFKEWDTNGDGYVEDTEYRAGQYKSWDSNQDNQVDRNEWNTSASMYGRDTVGWANWDIDASEFLNDEEYTAGFNREGWYKTWDTNGDNRLSDREFSDGLFKQFDKNGNGQLDSDEYQSYQTYRQMGAGTDNPIGAPVQTGSGAGNQ